MGDRAVESLDFTAEGVADDVLEDAAKSNLGTSRWPIPRRTSAGRSVVRFVDQVAVVDPPGAGAGHY